MGRSLLIHGAKQLLTLRGPSGPRRGTALNELGIILDGSVLVSNGVIQEVGPSRRVENLAEARNAEVLDAAGCVVMPGFIDSHTHLVSGPPRLTAFEMRAAGASEKQIDDAGAGFTLSMRHVRNAPVPRLLHGARRTLKSFIRHGTTTLEAKSGYGLDESTEWKLLRAAAELNGHPLDVAATYLGALAVPPEFKGRADAYIEWICTSMLPRIQKRRLARFVDVYCDHDGFTIEQARRYLVSAREHGFLLKVHAEQFERTGAAQLAVELGAVSADHLEQVSEEDVRALGQSGTVGTLLPGCAYYLGLKSYAPARRLIENGVAVALATDFNPGDCPTCSMPMVLSLACTQMHMTPAEAISAATINGAHALRIAESAGSLEVNKQADVVILDVPDYRELPYHFGVNPVRMTIKRGAVLYKEGEVSGIDD